MSDLTKMRIIETPGTGNCLHVPCLQCLFQCRLRDMTYSAPITVDIEYTRGSQVSRLSFF